MRGKLILIACSTAFVLGTGCGGDDGPSPGPSPATHAITGIVRATAPSGTPISSARVSILDGPDAGKSATSSNDGRYALTGVQAATFNIAASASGYEDRTGTLVLSADRSLDFELRPLSSMTTTHVDTTIEPCNGETYIVCYAYPFDIHNPGPVTLTLTAAAGSEVVVIDLYIPARGFAWYSNSHPLTGTRTITLCDGCPIDRYQLRIIGRILRRVPISFTITHPN